jgi:hypothetical protein
MDILSPVATYTQYFAPEEEIRQGHHSSPVLAVVGILHCTQEVAQFYLQPVVVLRDGLRVCACVLRDDTHD